MIVFNILKADWLVTWWQLLTFSFPDMAGWGWGKGGGVTGWLEVEMEFWSAQDESQMPQAVPLVLSNLKVEKYNWKG